jgi:hypothetical protein
MKTGGQVTDRLEPDSDSQAEDEDEDDGYDDTNTLSIRTLASFDEGKLKDALQDRFAELVSNRKNGEYVAATLLAESPDKLAIIVARNEGFSNDDRKFMRKIESLLRNIARGISNTRLNLTGTHITEVSDTKAHEAVWQAMLAYSQARLSSHIADFLCSARSFAEHSSQTSFDKRSVNELRNAVIELVAMVQDDSRSAAIQLANAIWKDYGPEQFLELCESNEGLATKLRLRIGFLGRLRKAYNVLVQAAERLDNCKDLSISPLPVASQAARHNGGKKIRKTWTLANTFTSLGLELNESTIKTMFGKNWSLEKLSTSFENMQKKRSQFHAEMQLVLYATQNGLKSRAYSGYIGCSKRSCFLCWEFLRSHGSFSTRASHGKLFHPWTIPDGGSMSDHQLKRFIASVKVTEEVLKTRLLAGHTQKRQAAKESTVGDSSIETRVPHYRSPWTMHLVSQHLRSQDRRAKSE